MRVLTNREERLIESVYMGEYIRRNYQGVNIIEPKGSQPIQYAHNNMLNYVFENTTDLNKMRKEYIAHKRAMH